MSHKTKPTKTFKWKVLHIDDEESEAHYFKSKSDAIHNIMIRSGYMIYEVKE